ncbi:ABC transporter permease [Alkalicoccobacillus porphyridii]|uniref:ABC transporter permease n=1 Tax=Alkalicoccobacillus porphyridii TaxID=2597270 RepID=A0A553ZXX7_9BACI|nr:ABC transporter permease [Alkalicoccobacillus porphyridii]TSB46216.1 ABC transporter permease [Alkalicoccobacillus porphyridii]
MVSQHAKQTLKKRSWRRLGFYKLKLLVIFLVVFSTTGIFLGFFVGTSSVLQSVEHFNSNYNVEDGNFRTMEDDLESTDDIHLEQIRYGEVREAGTTIRVFQERQEINRYQVTNGEDIQEEYDILLDYNYMNANNFEINDQFVLNDKELTIVGTAISPDYITTKNSDLVLQANADVFGVAFVNEETFQAIFGDTFTSYYAYKSNLDVKDISKAIDPLHIMDSKNNTRIQQVIGDAEAPRDLALLLTCLLFLIVAVLLSVYHFEVSKKEKNNLDTFNKLGFDNWTIFRHYSTETSLTLLVAWLVGATIGIFSIDTIKQMNSQIYNYPVLETNHVLLALCLVASLTIALSINLLLVYQFYIKSKKRTSKVKPVKQKEKFVPEFLQFSYRYRLKRINRNKKEMVLFIVLIFFVGLLINFSFLLKDSVTKYVDDLAKENSFEEILFLDGDIEEDIEGEEFNLYNLYDEAGITQSVYVINTDSKHYKFNLDLDDGDVIITQAFSDKYHKSIGDEIVLTDMTNQEEYNIEITKVNNVTTVSTIYIISDDRDIFGEKTFSTPALALSESYDNRNDSGIEATLTRSEIITSGENILDVINKQITLILSLAIILQVALLYSLLEFSYQNSTKSIKVFKLEGYSTKELMRMHFAFSIPIAFLCIMGSYLLSREIVRIFLDQIMFDFVNFVKVTNSMLIILSSNGMMLIIFIFLLLRLRTKMSK